jgi:hypothetical protein
MVMTETDPDGAVNRNGGAVARAGPIEQLTALAVRVG